MPNTSHVMDSSKIKVLTAIILIINIITITIQSTLDNQIWYHLTMNENKKIHSIPNANISTDEVGELWTTEKFENEPQSVITHDKNVLAWWTRRTIGELQSFF